MSVEVFLGNPPENIKQWIISHLQPATHTDTIFTFNGGQTVSLDITGELGNLWKWDDDVSDYILDYDGPEKLRKSYLTEVDIGTNVTGIGAEVFSYCVNMESVTIPNSVTIIGESAFDTCYKLTNMIIPNNVKRIENSVFSNCDNLMSVTIPNGVTSIGQWAFNYCSKLTNVTIPNSVISIESFAFEECSGLMSMTIPNSVTSIGNGAFAGCSGLTNVTFLGKTISQVQELANYSWGIENTSIIHAEIVDGPVIYNINGGTFLMGGGTVVYGENMRFADNDPGSHIVIKDSEGTDMQVTISTDQNIQVTEERFGLNMYETTPFIEGAEYTFEFSMLDNNNQPVTVAKTAVYISE